MKQLWLWSRICSAVEAGEMPLALAVEMSDEHTMAAAWAALRGLTFTDFHTILQLTTSLPRRAEITAVNAAILARDTLPSHMLRRAAELLQRYQDPENDEYAYDDRISFDDVRVALDIAPDYERRELWAWEALDKALHLVGFRRGEPTIDPFEYKGENGPRRVRTIIDHLARQAGVPWRDLIDVMLDFGPPTVAEVVDAIDSGWGRR